MSLRGSRMPSIGGGTVDIRSIIGSIVNAVKSRANQVCTAPCDGLVLKMHYRWTFFIMLGGFFTVWYQWYNRDVITCVSHFNAETQVRLDYMNICLSYPYVELEGGQRRYLLFYRWISWSLLTLAGIYYIPRKVSKNSENVKAKKLLEDIAANAPRYDHAEKELMERASRYIIYNLKTHNGLYYKYLMVNCIALLVDLFALFYLDFVIQGRFLKYGFNAYPFERDPKEFTDYMSQTFPPFAFCELDEGKKLVAKRTELFGCHLTIMELYEKVFLGLWLWLIILTTITIGHIIFLCLMWLPCVKSYLLRTAKPIHATDKITSTITAVAHNCKIGDIFLLYRLKSHFSHPRFYELLARLSNPDLCKNVANPIPQTSLTGDPKDKMPTGKNQELRNRRPNVPNDPPVNPDYLQTLLNNPEMMGRMPPGHGMDLSQRQPLLNKKNTSILIE
ncbi:innexin inx2-like isoform X1 [Oratosquilla oratoria]|uniref:innexin inx2-like isoform X1 n=1 Tax=Oratosquilla oratoria TaxID=337810 RepID=UPI003F76D8E2